MIDGGLGREVEVGHEVEVRIIILIQWEESESGNGIEIGIGRGRGSYIVGSGWGFMVDSGRGPLVYKGLRR